jgi:glyoxylase-like metal-dependent hydrolase (beta-lactamase superfamily II)
MTSVGYAIYVTPSIPTDVADVPPGLQVRAWSPITSTLVYGQRDAVLVDPLMTREQATALADWVAASGKRLTTIYITHGHGDHWFGLSTVLGRFPNARAVAVDRVVGHMREQMAPAFVESFWNSRFPGQIPDPLTPAEVLEGDRFDLEGHELVVVELGHTDTDNTTALHVPSIGLVIAGDAAYNDVHLYLAESPAQGRRDWLGALEIIESLHPRAVIAGHKRAHRPDSPAILAETRSYIEDFERVAGTTSTTLELYHGMLALHPDRINRGALWGSARSAKGWP